MKINFLGQGFESISDDSLGNHITELLKDKDYHTFTIITAFTGISAVRGLQGILREVTPNHTSKTIITGIDQFGTSKEALELLLASEVDSYIFFQPASSIFHPKVYLFEGDKKAAVMIGSSNFTGYGLFVNVEASLKLVVDKDEPEYSVVKDLKDYFKSLFDFSDPNLKKLDQELINTLLTLNKIPTEIEKARLYNKTREGDISVPKAGTSNTNIVLFPKRLTPTVPEGFTKNNAAAAVPRVPYAQVTNPGIRQKALPPSTTRVAVKAATPSAPAVTYPVAPALGQLVWYSASLPASSVQQITKPGTNPTGGLRLVQAKFLVAGVRINQRTYFRNLFGNYAWALIPSPAQEIAVIPFEVEVLGVNHGIHNLQVRHKPSGDAGQNNYTTLISWGTVANVIQAQNLTGRSLSLYEPTIANGAFKIVIS